MAANGKHIVLIDDDPDFQEAVKLMLEPEGYKLSMYLTGDEGMKAIQADQPDLILLDIMLASPSEGLHIAYELKKDEKLAGIPVIMISAVGERMGMDFAKEADSDYIQAVKFLEKPLQADTFRAAVKEALGL